MAIEVFNRHENKYIIDDKTLSRLQNRLADHMQLDAYNQQQETYSITNLYYDTLDNYLIRTSLQKPVYKEKLRFGRPRSHGKTLKITIPENLDYQGAFEDILDRYTLTHRLNRVRTTELGSLFELVYAITTREDMREKDLIDELRCRNGNLGIVLVMNAQSDDF